MKTRYCIVKEHKGWLSGRARKGQRATTGNDRLRFMVENRLQYEHWLLMLATQATARPGRVIKPLLIDEE